MKRRFWLAACAIGAVAACTLAAAPGAARVEISALKWVSSEADPVAALSTQPATCLTALSDQVRNGEALFNSPLLLGGQASKAGLSCASCHQNGRGNRDFVFSGISGEAGTADVTHGLFGPKRADDLFNPVSIPDLALASGRTRVDRGASGILEAFLSAQIVEEFDGAPPTPAMIAALASYVRALDAGACDPAAVEPKTWQQEAARISAGLGALERFGDSDPATARAYAHAVRAGLGRLHARYAGISAVQTELERLSLMVRDGAPTTEIEAALRALKPRLAEQAERSLYNREQLRRALVN